MIFRKVNTLFLVLTLIGTGNSYTMNFVDLENNITNQTISNTMKKNIKNHFNELINFWIDWDNMQKDPVNKKKFENTSAFDYFTTVFYQCIKQQGFYKYMNNLDQIWKNVLKSNIRKIKKNNLQDYKIYSVKDIMQHYIHTRNKYFKNYINTILNASDIYEFEEKYTKFINEICDLKKHLLPNDLSIVSKYIVTELNFNKRQLIQHITYLSSNYVEKLSNEEKQLFVNILQKKIEQLDYINVEKIIQQ